MNLDDKEGATLDGSGLRGGIVSKLYYSSINIYGNNMMICIYDINEDNMLTQGILHENSHFIYYLTLLFFRKACIELAAYEYI